VFFSNCGQDTASSYCHLSAPPRDHSVDTSPQCSEIGRVGATGRGLLCFGELLGGFPLLAERSAAPMTAPKVSPAVSPRVSERSARGSLIMLAFGLFDLDVIGRALMKLDSPVSDTA
jgi:hypothetical protein